MTVQWQYFSQKFSQLKSSQTCIAPITFHQCTEATHLPPKLHEQSICDTRRKITKRMIQKGKYFQPCGIASFRKGVKNQNTLQESIGSKLLSQTRLFRLWWWARGILEGWWAELTYTTPSTVRPDRSTNCLPKSYLFKYKSEQNAFNN